MKMFKKKLFFQIHENYIIYYYAYQAGLVIDNTFYRN